MAFNSGSSVREYNIASACVSKLRGMDAAQSMSPFILSGVFDRFPDFRIFFAETRVGWVPFWLEMADY